MRELPAENKENLKHHGSFVAFMALGSMSIVYFITFKNYHGSLQKLETLTALFNNPNARVAAGKKGKKLMKKIAAVQEPEEKKPVEKKEKAVAKPLTESEHTLNKVKELLEQKKKLQPEITVVPTAPQPAPQPTPQLVQAYVPPKVAPTNNNKHYVLPTAPEQTIPTAVPHHHMLKSGHAPFVAQPQHTYPVAPQIQHQLQS